MGSAEPGTTRRYDSTGRQAQVVATRRRIVEAAVQKFVAGGYGSTSIADIAKAAGVSAPTVYASFAGKADLLKAAIDFSLAGDDAPIPVAQRPRSVWVHQADTAEELVARWAVLAGELTGRAGLIYDVLIRAADAAPDLRPLLADMERQRHNAISVLVDEIRKRGGLPDGRSVAEARDVTWVCTDPSHFVFLTVRRRWSRKRYVEWIRNALTKLVIEPDSTPPPESANRQSTGA
jgi:AcrR family transcriptional regulator